MHEGQFESSSMDKLGFQQEMKIEMRVREGYPRSTWESSFHSMRTEESGVAAEVRGGGRDRVGLKASKHNLRRHLLSPHEKKT